jgi:MFS family permease
MGSIPNCTEIAETIFGLYNIFAENRYVPRATRYLSFLIKNKVLRYPLFRNFLAYRFSIIMSLNMQSTILYYWMYHITNDISLVGVLGLFEAIPAITCSFFSGHFVDLREKKKLIATCVFGYLLLSAYFVFFSTPVAHQTLGTSHIVKFIYAGVFLGGVLRSFVSPATFALLGMLVPRRHYPGATTWSSTSWQIGAVIGPLVGGFLLQFGITGSLCGVVGLQCLALLAVLRIPTQAVLKKAREPILKSLREGLRFVFNTQLVLSALSLDMFAVLFGGAVALLPAYAKDILHVGVIGFGWLRAAPGIGSLITAIILSFYPIHKNPGAKLMFCIAGFGVATIVFGVSTSFPLSLAMLVLSGMFDMISVIVRGIILQLYTPDEMRGRVAAVNTMFISSSNELGAVESGYTAKWMGTVPSVVFGGCMTLVVVGVTYFAAPRLKRFKQVDEPEI